MAGTKVVSFDELIAESDTRYVEIPLPDERGVLKIGSVCSADIMEWFDENDNPATKTFAGLRLLVKSIVNPDGTRIPKERWTEALEQLKRRDSLENGKAVQQCLVLNGLRLKAKEETEKNGSSEAPHDASPTASPWPPAKSTSTESSGS